jgi:hypothetical protein
MSMAFGGVERGLQSSPPTGAGSPPDGAGSPPERAGSPPKRVTPRLARANGGRLARAMVPVPRSLVLATDIDVLAIDHTVTRRDG